MSDVDNFFRKSLEITQNYFNPSSFEKKTDSSGKATFFHGDNAHLLLHYLSFTFLIAPLTMGLGLIASQAYVSLRGRVTEGIDPSNAEKKLDSCMSNQPVFSDAHNLDVDTKPTSPHAGVVLALPKNRESPMLFVRKISNEKCKNKEQCENKEQRENNEKWENIDAKKIRYETGSFTPVDLTKCRVTRGDADAYHIQVGEETHRLPVHVGYRSGLWEANEAFKSVLDEKLKLVNVEIKPDSAPSSISKPEVDQTFIQNPNEFFTEKSTQNGLETTNHLQAKGYLSQNEYCADWTSVESQGNVTLALVSDAAGNQKKSHEGSVKLVNLFRENFWAQLKNRNEGETIADALSQALLLTEIETQADGTIISTMVCTAIVTDENQERYAVGFCIGDARAILKREHEPSIDLTPTEFASPYSYQGSHFGRGIKTIQPIFQKLEKGDTLLLGSDGFGDNIEAKSLGVSPLLALHHLEKAGKLANNEALQKLAKTPEPWIKQADKTSFWTLEKKEVQTPEANEAREWQGNLSKQQRGLVQELHNLYSQHVIDKMDSENISEQLHHHCTESVLVKAAVFLAEISKDIAEKDPSKDPSTVFKDHLEDYKKHTQQLQILSASEQSDLFSEWDANPEKAHIWLMDRIGKPDDFSLISLSIA